MSVGRGTGANEKRLRNEGGLTIGTTAKVNDALSDGGERKDTRIVAYIASSARPVRGNVKSSEADDDADGVERARVRAPSAIATGPCAFF